MTVTKTSFQFHRWRTEPETYIGFGFGFGSGSSSMELERRFRDMFTELKRNFLKVLRTRTNQTLIIKDHGPNTNPKFWVLSHIY